MKVSTKGKNLIKKFEGLRLKAYQCPAKIWTIGYGHTLFVQPGDIIDENKANIFLKEDVRMFENNVNELVHVSLNQNQFDALVSLVFNIGVGNFKKSTLLKKLNSGDMSGASEELLRWVYVKGKKSNGLIHRRNAEKKLFDSEA